MPSLKLIVLLLLAFYSTDGYATSLSRPPGTPKYLYQARSLIVCQAKCKNQCNSANLMARLRCNQCMQGCIRKENMVYEDGPEDRGLIRAVAVCCARLATFSTVSIKLYFDFSDNEILKEAFAVLEYRRLSDLDDLYSPPWTITQIVRDRAVTITDLECGFTYQFRLTLIATRILNRRTSLWISNRHLCRYGAVHLSE
ncbi:unnamed protein product [Cylicocyclus nassatus]|uniref:Fibronectin type-III domain-containing protein n=1 Tax=Cylicocyclus nassatus TaxID=53992 RepID=A0AA36DTK7_CYLNA|nr:unnamed protein product [Cylicocyclus nassatus]